MVKISTIVLILVAAATVGMLLIDPSLGLIYAVSVLPVPLFILLTRNRPPFIMMPVFVAAVSFFVFYFVRPLILVSDPDIFTYWKLFIRPDPAIMGEALAYQGVYAFTFLCGLFAVTQVAPGLRMTRPAKAFRQSVVAQLGPSFLFLLAGLSALWLGLVFLAGVGTKGTEDTSLELLSLVLPVSLIVPVAIGYLAGHSFSQLTRMQRLIVYLIILANVLTIILSGSKAGIFLLVLYLVIYRILMQGDFRTPLSQLLTAGLIGVVLISLSVFFANAIRLSNAGAVSIEQYTDFALQNDNVSYMLAVQITARFIGFDGMIAVLLVNPPAFESVGRWDYILMQALAKLIPGYSYPGLSVGNAVGTYFEGREITAAHAGALGLSGMLQQMHGIYVGPVVAMLVGAIFGFLYRLMDAVCARGAPERITGFLALGYLMATWISSGNFDRLIQNTVILFAHMIFYFMLIKLFMQMTSRGGLRGVER